MKNTYYPLLLSLLLITCSFASQKKWFHYSSAEHGYSIDFPSKPASSVRTVDSEIGELTMTITMYDASGKTSDKNEIYMVSQTIYPDSLVNSNQKENLPGFFKNSIQGAVNNVSGKLLLEEEIEIEGYPGREVKIDYQEGLAVIQMRFYLVENRLYLLQTITKTSNLPNSSINKFMNSFQLIIPDKDEQDQE